MCIHVYIYIESRSMLRSTPTGRLIEIYTRALYSRPYITHDGVCATRGSGISEGKTSVEYRKTLAPGEGAKLIQLYAVSRAKHQPRLRALIPACLRSAGINPILRRETPSNFSGAKQDFRIRGVTLRSQGCARVCI